MDYEPHAPASPADLAAGDPKLHYSLRLYVTGSTRKSARAIANIRRVCEEHLPGRHDLEIVDVSHHPERLGQDQVVALPTLVKLLPAPLRRFIGDLSQEDRLLVGLDVRQTTENREPA